jgi:putative ABC transport system substrate-binding protein
MASRIDALRAGLRELGYVEGKNIAIEYRWAEGKYDRLPQLATELVQLKVEVIVTHGTPGTRAAKQATSTIPIVMAVSGDAVLTGLVASMARPGGNVTGSTFFSPEITAKRLELLKETLPGLSQVAVVVNPGNPLASTHLKGTAPVAKSLKVGLHSVEARSPAEFESAFGAMATKQVDGVVVTDDTILVANAKALADLALKRRMPLIGGAEFAEAGGLIAFGANIPAMYGHAAVLVGKILKGAKPADLPIEQATKFEFVVNLKTASALKLKIPQSILVRANRVIE